MGPVPVTVGPPAREPSGEGVGLHLLRLLPEIPRQATTFLPPLRLELRYLVTTWSEAPDAAHERLGELLFAALDAEGFEVPDESLTPADWLALGVAPRAAFLLGVDLTRERPRARPPLVRRPADLRASPVATLHGVVVGFAGDEEAPLADALVEVPALGRHATTDPRGRFRLTGLPDSQDLFRWMLTAVKGDVQRKDVSIIMLRANGTDEAMRWNLFETWPSAWRGAAFDAMSREVAIERLTLVYERLEIG